MLKTGEKVSSADQKKPLLGLFDDGNMPTVLTGPQATLHGNLEKPAVKCEANPKHTALSLAPHI